MRFKLIIISLLLFCVSVALPGKNPGRIPVYMEGERLTYQIYYGLLNGGKVEMTLEPTWFNGEKVLHAKATGYTTGLANRIFRIYDVYQSFMEPRTGLPVKAIRDISEGSYRYYNEVLFDRDSNTVVSQLSGVNEVPEGILDMISVIYKLRDTLQTYNFNQGDILEFTTYFSDKVYPVVVQYSNPEVINTRKGTFNALKFYPASEPGRVFKSDNDITVWLSNDKNFVPLRVRLNMLVGSVRMDLVEAEGLRYRLHKIQ